MSDHSLPYDPQAIALAADDELVYRARSLVVRHARAKFRGWYEKTLALRDELEYVESLCRVRDLQPYDGGWYELTAPSELGRWL